MGHRVGDSRKLWGETQDRKQEEDRITTQSPKARDTCFTGEGDLRSGSQTASWVGEKTTVLKSRRERRGVSALKRSGGTMEHLGKKHFQRDNGVEGGSIKPKPSHHHNGLMTGKKKENRGKGASAKKKAVD